MYFRLLMVGYFEGIDSERGIAWRAADSLGIRAFLGVALEGGGARRETQTVAAFAPGMRRVLSRPIEIRRLDGGQQLASPARPVLSGSWSRCRQDTTQVPAFAAVAFFVDLQV